MNERPFLHAIAASDPRCNICAREFDRPESPGRIWTDFPTQRGEFGRIEPTEPSVDRQGLPELSRLMWRRASVSAVWADVLAWMQ